MTMQVSATEMRKRIPTEVLTQFEELTNDELAYMAEHSENVQRKAYFGWELEYREAFRIEVYIDKETGELKRRRS